MKSLDNLVSGLMDARKQVEYQVMRNAPRIMGEIAVKNIKQNFKIQGYEGEEWSNRSETTNKIYLSPDYKAAGYSPSNPLLMQSLTLLNAIKAVPLTKRVWVGVRDQYHNIGKRAQNVAEYARGNNEGTINIPRRKFMPMPGEGIPYRWERQIFTGISLEMDKAMRNFKL